MKKIISIILLIALAMVSLSACDSKTSENTSKTKRFEDAYNNAKEATEEATGDKNYEKIVTLSSDKKTITVLYKYEYGEYKDLGQDLEIKMGAALLERFTVAVKNIAKELEISDSTIKSILDKTKDDVAGSVTENDVKISYEGLHNDKTSKTIKKSITFEAV